MITGAAYVEICHVLFPDHKLITDRLNTDSTLGPIQYAGSAGSLLPALRLNRRRFAMAIPFSSVVFAHAVNSRVALDNALANKTVNVLEADIIYDVLAMGAMMGHDPGSPSDLSFESFVAAANSSYVGVKADIKMCAATSDVIRILSDQVCRSLYDTGLMVHMRHVLAHMTLIL